MKPKVKKQDENDWIYDPIVVKGILRAKKEADIIIEKGGKLSSLDDLLEQFRKEDAKNNLRKIS